MRVINDFGVTLNAATAILASLKVMREGYRRKDDNDHLRYPVRDT